jgi:magnesium-protoporphyrin IX monomethyl ester (oxidative) cyclase
MPPEPRPIKRILLIFPPVRIQREGIKIALPPMGPACLAAVVRDKYDVAILDALAEGFHNERPSSHGFYVCGLSLDEIGRRIGEYKPDIVGITCLYSSTFPVVAEVCKVSKAAAPDALTVVGGTHPSFLPERCLQEAPELDMVAIGEGEPVLLDLLEALEKGKDLSGVDGLAYRDSGGIRVNEKRRFVEDLDSLPFPARDLLPMELYQQIGVPHLLHTERKRFSTVITSRGCPAKCSFCSSWKFWGNRYRARSPESILDELELLVRDYGIEEVQFEDDNISLDPARFKQILQGMLDRDLKLSWSTPNGLALWTLDRDIIGLMKQSGCYEITLAIESGCQEVLDHIIHKPLKLKKIPVLIEEIQRVGIRTSCFFIVGFPGESLEQMKQTFETPRKLGLTYAWFFIANPLPGTRLYEICEQAGYLKNGFDFTNNSFSRCNIETPQWSARQVEALAHREFFRFNLYNLARHPVALWRRYRNFLRNPRLVAEIVKSLVRRSLAGLGP